MFTRLTAKYVQPNEIVIVPGLTSQTFKGLIEAKLTRVLDIKIDRSCVTGRAFKIKVSDDYEDWFDAGWFSQL